MPRLQPSSTRCRALGERRAREARDAADDEGDGSVGHGHRNLGLGLGLGVGLRVGLLVGVAVGLGVGQAIAASSA